MATVPSPCTGICSLDPNEVCIGCGRTIEEIAEWSSATSTRQSEIVAAAGKRAHKAAE